MFGQFLQAGPLLDEHNPDAPQGGSEPATPPVPAFDPAAFRADFKKELLIEIRKDINGIDKNNRKQAEAQQQYLDSKFTDLLSRFEQKPADPPADPAPSDPPAVPPTPPAAAPANQPTPQPGRHTPSPSELAMQKRIAELESASKKQQEQLEKEKRDAAKKDRQIAIKNEIGKYQFSTPAQDPVDFYELVENKVERDDSDGHYYGPEGVPLEEFIKAYYSVRQNWHPAKQVGGAGAPASSALPSNSKVFDMDMIRPGMTKEEKDRARAVIQQFGSGTIL